MFVTLTFLEMTIKSLKYLIIDYKQIKNILIFFINIILSFIFYSFFLHTNTKNMMLKC